jgi:prevent-host-death family protein
MQFVTVRDFRNSSRAIWDKVKEEGEVVVTNNGKPTAILVYVNENDFEETLQDIRRARLTRLLEDARWEAEERGFLSEEEIEAEITAARAEYKIETGRAL